MATEPNAALGILQRGRALLARGICYGANACDADGNYVAPSDPEACAWCSLGACIAASGRDDSAEAAAMRALFDAAGLSPKTDNPDPIAGAVADWHDEHAQRHDMNEAEREAAIFGVWDRAIAAQGG